MKKTNFDLGWRFTLDGSEEAVINLPHDFSVGLARRPDSRSGAKGGYFQGGNGVYKKALPDGLTGQVLLEIEGAYMNAEVIVNGNLAAVHPYGYTSFHVDLTPWLKPDGNELEVRVQNDALPNTRWYSGSGLYRHVWLLTGKDAYIEPWGIFATTPRVDPQQSVVRVEATVVGAGVLRHTLVGAAGETVASSEAAAAQGKSQQELIVTDAHLWEPGSPYLYTLRSELISGGQIKDTVETSIGIRSIALDKDQGFLLNGKPLKLKGGCVHHDCGILGAAAWDAAEERKVVSLKNAGYNAVRCAHNPPSPAFLDACDRHGIIVMNEAFDCWRTGKTPYDYHLYFEAWWERDIASMVLRDRNHPCIVFWSTGNEIPERRGESDGYRWAARLAEAVRKLDTTRLLSNGICGLWINKDLSQEWGDSVEQFAASLDVVGYNYLWQRYDDDLKCYPDRFIYATESTPGEAFEYWEMVLKHPRVIGDCVWTSMDYFGESGIGHTFMPYEEDRPYVLMDYPWHQANCGDLDICCRPRPQSFYRQILWGNRTAPWLAVHRPNLEGLKPEFNYWGWSDVHHSWSWPGFQDNRIFVDVYSQCDEVELFVNGKSLGRQPAGKAARNIASFETTYEPGTLKAIAYINGKPAGEDMLVTCGTPHAIRLEADRSDISAEWGGLAYVTATIVDESGHVVPYATNELFFTTFGAGAVLAVGTNNPVSEEAYIGNRRRAFEATATCAVRSSGEQGEIVLTVSAEGLKAAEIVITTR